MDNGPQTSWVEALFNGVERLKAKANRATRVGRMRLAIHSVRKEMDLTLCELGSRVHFLASQGEPANILQDETITRLLRRVNACHQEIDSLEHTILALPPA
ncbi:MAG: hypothetical protein COW73_01965 [Nitrospirae bacterium CG18_big_fil_WC_8_21_14_2_50_70_55]|nr:hypothetical protein [Deltaproteobacteria bacterium]OIP64784.1 MAG: hypothetical protein AUK30_06070 [Nitrospirae bacterium CG2_30_70_394]PIQ06881.1 MAG: hypothetical protein COW73_01965 [Nitrospirae bacterium CG18_big_fil_WC_8_21_14_2_50_70_55]PIU79968.1 MAG: hypothetical protein COS73_01690 [Nitrospirae bacterium CG06_land_8_20_14_3_00_70_43]PIW83670.1 MAG: hypothetical protein COZ96_02135 [Nitrospirae bacterium CG_4_8_14_3_um_filter_70_85]PIX83596.1 MAG: hypothetical protein COZ33_04670 